MVLNIADLNIADYENVFDDSFDFNSIWVDKDLEGKKNPSMFQQAIKYKKLPVVYLIIYHRYLNGICKVTSVSTSLKFSKLEKCWKK